MCLLFSLNKYISIPIISEWLFLSDFIALSVAVTNLQLQITFKEWVKSYPKLFENYFAAILYPTMSIDMFMWMENYALDTSCVEHIKLTRLEIKTIERIGFGNSIVTRILAKLKRLTLYYCSDYYTSVIYEIVMHCFSLESINIDACSCSDSFLKAITSPNLTEIRINNCEIVKQELQVCSELQLFPHLRKFTVTDCYGQSHLLNQLSITCRLESITCRNYELETDYNMTNLLLFHNGRIKEFNYFPIRDVQFKLLVLNHYQSLTSLDISQSRKITEYTVCGLAKLCINLTNINLSYCSGIGDAGVTAFCTAGGSKLKIVDLRCLEQLTDASLLVLSASCTNLTELYLYNNLKLSENGLLSIIRCIKLRVLCLSLINISPDCLTALLTKCTAIEDLDINNYHSDQSILQSIENSRCSISKLNLYYCTLIKSSEFMELFASYHCITDLNLGYCGLLTAPVVTYIIHKCIKLVSLSLQSVTIELSSEICFALLRHSASLKYLNLNGVIVSIDIAKVLIQSLFKLKFLVLSDELADELEDDGFEIPLELQLNEYILQWN